MTDLELRKFIISNSPIQIKWCCILSIIILFIVDVMVVQMYI